MSVAFRSAAADDNPTSVSASLVAVPRPAGVIDGDFLLASVGIVGGAAVAVTPPSGWTLLRRTDQGTTYGLALYYRFAQGEGASWSWSFSASAVHVALVRAYVGVDAFFPVDAEISQQNASSTSQQLPSVTTSVPAGVLAVCVVANGNVTFTAPASYSRRATKSQTSISVECEDTPLIGAGATASATVTLSAGQLAIAHTLALRPSVGVTATVEQARTALKALFPPGDDSLYDWDNSTDPSQLWLLTQAIAQFLKAYGYDWVDLLRQEVNPLAMVANLTEWEGALGITQSSASAVNKWTATRQTAVLSKLRESGASTLAAIRAVLEPLLGYSAANTGTLTILEADRTAQKTAHTYSNNTGAAIGALSSTTQSLKILDDGAISAAGVQLRVTITSTNPEQLSFQLVGPTGVNGQANVTWPAGSLPVGSVTSSDFYLYEHATSAGKSVFAHNLVGATLSWQLTVNTGAATCTLVSWALFVEGGGRDPLGYDGLGGAVFEWAPFADPAKVNAPDYQGARNAITRIEPAYSRGELVQNTSAFPSPTLYPPFIPLTS